MTVEGDKEPAHMAVPETATVAPEAVPVAPHHTVVVRSDDLLPAAR
jgi:hypothetical protein